MQNKLHSQGGLPILCSEVFWGVDASCGSSVLEDGGGADAGTEGSDEAARYPGHVTAFVPGKFSSNDLGHFVAKYGKFAYDSIFAFSIPKNTYQIKDAAPDSMLAFWIDGNVYVRRTCENFCVTSRQVISTWSPYPGITVETTIPPTQEGHIRSHLIYSEVECEGYDCGFAIDSDVCGCEEERTVDSASVRNEYCGCRVKRTDGYGEPVIIDAAPNTNMLSSKTRIPAIRYAVCKGESKFVTVITAEYKAQVHIWEITKKNESIWK